MWWNNSSGKYISCLCTECIYIYIHMLIYLKLVRKKRIHSFLIPVILIKPLLVFQRTISFYFLWKILSKHKNMCCFYGFRVNDGKFHTPFRNGSSSVHSVFIHETQFLHYIFSFFLLHRGKRYINLPSALRLSGHKDCSSNWK